MARRKREGAGTYPGGIAFNRARKQFQVLFEKEGTLARAMSRQEMILWPDLKNEDGTDLRPPLAIFQLWAQEVDDGEAEIPEKLRKAFLSRYDAYTEAVVREALIENAKTAKALAVKVREGKLQPQYSSQYMHANNGTSFLLKESMGRNGVPEAPRKIANMKFLSPKKRALKEGAIEGEYTVIK